MPTMITVSIAKLGTSIQKVQVAPGSAAMEALRSAGYDLDSVVSIKRNGEKINLDTALRANDTLLVSMEKIKGGRTTAPAVIKLSFDIVERQDIEEEDYENELAFETSMSTFDIIKEVLTNNGRSLNDFVRIQDEDGEEIGLGETLEDGQRYTIVVE